jgi:S1-C subfamily serine protease
MKKLLDHPLRAPWLALATLTALAVTGPASAQEPDREIEEDRNCICFDDLTDRVNVVTAGPRARLGIRLGREAEVDGRVGVRIDEVPAGTPADRAGLREGDVVVALDHEPLGEDAASRLIDRMREHEPGDTVAVTFYRDGGERTVRVVTDQAEGYTLFGRGPGHGYWATPGTGQRFRERLERIAPRLRGRSGAGTYVLRSVRGDAMRLVEIGPELGRYFDTDRGVLVTEIDDDSTLGLRTGDVILAIDGRDVRDPGHVRSILGSYLEDETITFSVMRDGRRVEVRGSRH